MCRHCLVSCFELSAKRCPSCRAPTSPSLAYEWVQPNHLLVNLLKQAFPSRYRRREATVLPIKEGWKRKFPIFFQSDLLFPYQSVLLNLHEPRYQLMLQRLQQIPSRAGPRAFALIASGPMAVEGAVGIICEVVGECLSESGAVQVNAKGRCQVQSLWVEEGTGLAYCRVDFLEDVDEEEGTQVSDAVARILSLISSHDSLSSVSFHSKFGSIPSSPHHLSFWIFQALALDAGNVDPRMAAEVMSSRSLLWRLNVGEDLLHESIHSLMQQKALRQEEGQDRFSGRRRGESRFFGDGQRYTCPYAGAAAGPLIPSLPPGMYGSVSAFNDLTFEPVRARALQPAAYFDEHKQPPQAQDWGQRHARRARHQYQPPHRFSQRGQQPHPPLPQHHHAHPHWSPPLPAHHQHVVPGHRAAPSHGYHAYRPPSLRPPRSMAAAVSASPPVMAPGMELAPGQGLSQGQGQAVGGPAEVLSAFRPYSLF